MAPANTSKPHPVYVLIQGGGFNKNASPDLNGTTLIEAGDHDIVVVTFNYRVGPWGFLASKEVQANGKLNAGLLDQRFVLQWVQSHISKVGLSSLFHHQVSRLITKISLVGIQRMLPSAVHLQAAHQSVFTCWLMAAVTMGSFMLPLPRVIISVHNLVSMSLNTNTTHSSSE
jgi:hypothetical protein